MTTNKKLVLFVDDEQSCHNAIDFLFTDMNDYSILSAFTAEEALELAKDKSLADNIVLIMLDVMLPDIHGYELYEIFQKEKLLINVPVIFQTGMTHLSDKIKVLIAEQKAEVIHKPYNKIELVDAVNKLIHGVQITYEVSNENS